MFKSIQLAAYEIVRGVLTSSISMLIYLSGESYFSWSESISVSTSVISIPPSRYALKVDVVTSLCGTSFVKVLESSIFLNFFEFEKLKFDRAAVFCYPKFLFVF